MTEFATCAQAAHELFLQKPLTQARATVLAMACGCQDLELPAAVREATSLDQSALSKAHSFMRNMASGMRVIQGMDAQAQDFARFCLAADMAISSSAQADATDIFNGHKKPHATAAAELVSSYRAALNQPGREEFKAVIPLFSRALA